MAYANPEDAREYERRRTARRTEAERVQRRIADRARYWAKKRVRESETWAPGDYLRYYSEEHARAARELRGE